jgi:3-phosphoglycerate kinase
VADLMAKAKERNVTVHFPIDFVVGDEFKETTPHSVVNAKSGIPEGKMVIFL